jgi:hypothetical protein
MKIILGEVWGAGCIDSSRPAKNEKSNVIIQDLLQIENKQSLSGRGTVHHDLVVVAEYRHSLCTYGGIL